jgi:periplasmic protein TonB
MSEQLFHEIANPTVRVGSKTHRTVPLSIAAHVLVVAALIVVPLLATGAIPSPQSVMLYVAPPPLPAPPTPTPPAPNVARHVEVPNPKAAPSVEPPRISQPPSELPPASAVSIGGASGIPWTGGVPTGLPTFSPASPPAPPPPPTPPRVGGNIKEPAKIRDVRPTYPAIALAAKVSGIVIIEATIGRDGSIIDTRVLRSVPLLDQAAVEAVRQWRFTPTLLNGVPTPVLMTVSVNFTLN